MSKTTIVLVAVLLSASCSPGSSAQESGPGVDLGDCIAAFDTTAARYLFAQYD